MKKFLALLFGFRAPVTRTTYVVTGCALMAVKYAVDALLMWTFAAHVLGPATYLEPRAAVRVEAMGEAPEWLLLVMGLWALPFIWIGVSMSFRRARDAGLSPWLGLLFLMPIVNYFMIAALALATSRPPSDDHRSPSREQAQGHLIRSAFLAVLVTSMVGVAILGLSAFLLESYGSALFVGAPFVMGTLSTWLVHRGGYRGKGVSLLVALLSLGVCGGALLLLALEGLFCLLMALPLACGLALVGALVGDAMAQGMDSYRGSVSGMVIALPLMATAQGATPPVLAEHEVVSAIEIAASPDEVWPNVVGFSELPPPEHWLFRAGVACPVRARIDGEGVGAVRHCEFTTGPFVEPITVWEPPHRLAFDVIEQPPSMKEYSPWEVVHAPHLNGYMISKRGAFELTPLPDGGTRLEGTTWYTLNMEPVGYWAWWTDDIVHLIHERVLRHIKRLSERDG